MTNFNDSLVFERVNSRGSKFLRFLCVASADVAGAYELGHIGAKVGFLFGGGHGMLIGGGVCALVGAAGASYGASCGTRTSLQAESSLKLMTSAYSVIKMDDCLVQEYPREHIIIDLPDKHKDVLEIGIKHNIMLDLVRNDRLLVESAEANLSPEEKNILESDEFVENYNVLIPKYAALSVDNYLENNTMESKVMKLFLDIYSRYPENIQDVKFVVNKYIEMIEESMVFTEDEKERIYTGLSVAVCSFEYWEKNN